MAYIYTSTPVGPNTGYGQAQQLGQQQAAYILGQANQARYPFGWSPQQMASSGSGGSGGGAGGGYVSPNNIPGQYQQAYNQAKAANEQRYNDILTGYQDRTKNLMGAYGGQTDDVLRGYENRYQRGMQNLQGLGSQEKADVNQRYDQLGAKNYQDLVDRGLTSSTVLPNMRTGNERERSDALSRVNERLQRERLGYDASLSGDALAAQMQQYDRGNMLYGNLTGDTLGFAERRTDAYPDFGQLAQLAQAYGAGGGLAGQMGVYPGYQIGGNMGGGQGGGMAGFQWDANMQNPGMPPGMFVQPWWNQRPRPQQTTFQGQSNSNTSGGSLSGQDDYGQWVQNQNAGIDPALWGEKYGYNTVAFADMILKANGGQYPQNPEEAQALLSLVSGNQQFPGAPPAVPAQVQQTWNPDMQWDDLGLPSQDTQNMIQNAWGAWIPWQPVF